MGDGTVFLERDEVGTTVETHEQGFRAIFDFTRAITACVAEGICAFDRAGTITFVNPAAEQLLVAGASALLGRNVLDVIPLYTATHTRVEREASPLVSVLQCGETASISSGYIGCGSGATFPAAYTVSAFRIDGGVDGGVITFRDVTEERNLQTAKDMFYSSAAHDLRAPLTTISGYAQMLQLSASTLDGTDRTLLVRGLERIEKATDRMSGLIDQLLEMFQLEVSCAEALEQEPVDLAELVRQATAEAGSSAHCISVTAPAEAVIGQWDRRRLERVAGNLISNAVKYSPAGGDISISIEEIDEGGRRWAVLTVADGGLGIPAADLPHIFERFYRARNVAADIAGNGIGLAYVRQVVERHGGAVSVSSVQGAGASFTVRLPLAVESPS